jgi:hypothetical protein
MGYIPSATTKTLYAYLTQIGRKKLLFSSATESQVKYFSLHDDDINYRISSYNNNSIYNTLKKGFIPDVTGDDDDCIKSVAQAYKVPDNTNYLVWGGTLGIINRKLILEFEYPTNLIAGDANNDTADDWLHKQSLPLTTTPGEYRDTWGFGSQTGSGGVTKDPRFIVKLSIDPTEQDQTSPITIAEKELATFSIKLVTPYTNQSYIKRIFRGGSCNLATLNDKCDFVWTNVSIDNKFNTSNAYGFEIKQQWVIDNNPTIPNDTNVPTPLDIEFNFKLESNSPNVTIPPDKSTYKFVGKVQVRKTAVI